MEQTPQSGDEPSGGGSTSDRSTPPQRRSYPYVEYPDFDLDVSLTAEFRPHTVPFMAQQVATVREGRFAGTEVLMGWGGPIVQVVMDGETYGAVGFSYTDLVTAVLIPFSRHVKPELAPEVTP